MQPRREVWEYGGLPLQSLCPQLDGVQTLLTFHGKLFARSKAGRHGQRTVAPADVAQILELTTNQVDVLTEVLAALSFVNSASGAAAAAAASAPAGASHQHQHQPPPLGQEEILLHELSLFMLAQLFSKEAQRADAVEYWPDPNSNGFAGVAAGLGAGQELLSPTRRSQPGAARSLLRQQLQSHLRAQIMAMRGYGDYLRRNLRPAVELVLDVWPPAPSTLVSARELDRLGFVLGSTAAARSNGNPEPISSTVGATHGSTGGVYTPLSVEAVAGALRSLWQEECVDSPRLLAFSTTSLSSASSPSPKFQRSMGMVAPAGQVDDSAIAGVYRGTVVRGEGDLPHGDVRITDCHEAVIYVLAPLQAAFISGCSDCTIVVGAVGRLLRVERCDKVQIIAATNRLLIASCHECSFNVGSPRPPCLIGDNRFLRLGPFNTRYERQAAHAREVGLRSDLTNRFDTPVILVGKDRKSLAGSSPNSPRVGMGMGVGLATSSSGSSSTAAAAAAKSTFSLQSPEDFLPFVVPFVGGSGPLAGGSAPPHASRWNQLAASAQRGGGPLYLFPLPPDYERALQRRLNLTHDMRSKFKQAGLSKDKERELNDAIQGYFKEWLVGSNLLRQIYDLSTLEKEELAAASAGAAMGLSPVPGPIGMMDARGGL